MFWTTVKDIYIKVSPFLLIFVLIATSVIVVKLELDLKSQQSAMQQSVTEMKQFQDNIMRSQSQYASQDQLQQFAKDLGFKLDNINSDLAGLKAGIELINNTQIITPGYHGSDLPSSSHQPNGNPLPPDLPCDNGTCPNPDKYGYLSNIQTLQINEPFSNNLQIPFGSASFDASKPNPWDLTVKPRKYSSTTVIAEDDNGKHTAYSQFSVEVDGKSVDLPITSAKMLEKTPENKWRFNPRLYLGLAVKANVYNVTHPIVPAPEVSPELSVSLLSYGPTTLDTILSVGQIGIGADLVDPAFNVNISPVQVNVGHYMQPILSNLYVGPTISIDHRGDIGVGGSIKVGL